MEPWGMVSGRLNAKVSRVSIILLYTVGTLLYSIFWHFVCLQYYDGYSPDGIQNQYGYGLGDQEANYFGKEEKGMTHGAFEIADPNSMQPGRVSH